MNTWNIIKVKYTKQFTDGTLKRVSEAYLINALSFTEAEARVHKEVGELARGEFLVTSIATKNYQDVFHYEDAEVWFEAKVAYKMEDTDSGKEKVVKNNFLVSAHTVKEAYDRIEESLKDLMVTYEIEMVKVTSTIEVFPYVAMDEETKIKK